MGVIGEPGKVDLLIRDRLAVATPAGADALKAAYARLRGTIDPARTIANISAERDRLLRVYNDLPASCKKTVVEPPRQHVVDGIDPMIHQLCREPRYSSIGCVGSAV